MNDRARLLAMRNFGQEKEKEKEREKAGKKGKLYRDGKRARDGWETREKLLSPGEKERTFTRH